MTGIGNAATGALAPELRDHAEHSRATVDDSIIERLKREATRNKTRLDIGGVRTAGTEVPGHHCQERAKSKKATEKKAGLEPLEYV